MKRSDIKVHTDYAVSLKLRSYDMTNTVVRGTVVGFPDNYVRVYLPEPDEQRRVSPSAVRSTWEDHEKAQAAEEAKRQKERDRQNAAWEAKREAERLRFEQHILPAFKGLSTVNHVSGRSQANTDLADYIEDTMLDGGSTTVTLRETDLRGIADRIMELQQIVQQNALVASDPPEAGHSPLTNMQRIERELVRLEREEA